MANLTITAASVLAGSGNTQDGTAGTTITAGQPVYLDATTGTYKLAQNDGTAAEAAVAGISLHAALAGQPLKIQTTGTLTIGSTVVLGEIYILSATAGALCPCADLVSTNRTVLIGIATSTTVLTLCINNSGVQRA